MWCFCDPYVGYLAMIADKGSHPGYAERFKNIRLQLGLSQKEMADKLDVALSSWQRYEQGVGVAGGDVLQKMAELGFDVNWLLTGTGQMFWTLHKAPHEQSDLVLVPQFEVRPSAGNGGGLPESEEPSGFIALSKGWIRRFLRCEPENLVALNAGGDSMEPTIRDRDPLFVDRGDTALRNDAIYVFRLEDAVQVKRIQRKTTGEIVLISDNKNYPPETLSKVQSEALHGIGRVVWHGRIL